MQTTGYYNMNRLEPIGVVHGISVHSISAMRGLFSSFTGALGGPQPEIAQKYLDARNDAIKDITARAEHMRADEIIGLEIEMTELKNFVIFIAVGTAMKRKSKGGACKSKKKPPVKRKKKSIKNKKSRKKKK